MKVTDTFSKNLARYRSQIPQDVIDAARDEAVGIVRLAQDIVPRVTGHLAESGVAVDTPSGGAATFTADYAPDVHENPDSDGYRFLERAADERASGMLERMAKKAGVK